MVRFPPTRLRPVPDTRRLPTVRFPPTRLRLVPGARRLRQAQIPPTLLRQARPRLVPVLNDHPTEQEQFPAVLLLAVRVGLPVAVNSPQDLRKTHY